VQVQLAMLICQCGGTVEVVDCVFAESIHSFLRALSVIYFIGLRKLLLFFASYAIYLLCQILLRR